MEKNRAFYKVIIGGDGGVGKTTLLHRYVNDKFLDDTIMTIGVEFFQQDIETDNNLICSLLIWDLGGQKQFLHLIPQYRLGASGAILVFDLTRHFTFNTIPKWVELLRENNPKLPLILVGAKADMDNSSINDEDIQNLKDKFNFMAYIKTSAKTGLNVHKVFEILAKGINKHIELARQ